MTRSTLKLAPITDENSRAVCLKRRRSGLLKKVRELSTLCDLQVCVIIFSPNEVEPVVWPSVEEARDLLQYFFAFPVYERKRKETTPESYLIEKTRKLREKLMKMQKKERDFVVDQLMVQLQRGRELGDLNSNEINDLQSFAHEKMQRLRKRLRLIVEDPPRSEPLMHPFFGGLNDEGVERANDAVRRICIADLRENQTHYLMDTWVFNSYETSDPNFYQQIRMEMAFRNMNLGGYLPYQGSSSNGNSNFEMKPIGPPMMTPRALVASVDSQPLQYHDDNKAMVMNQPRSNNNNGDPQFHLSINTIATNHGLRQEPSPNQNGPNH